MRHLSVPIYGLSLHVLWSESNAALSFVNQYDGELADLKKARRPGRPPSAKEDLLKRKIEALTSEHDTGFRMPSLESPNSILM